MIVYGDLLFLINFSMDFLCFYISCLLLHKKLPTLRACFSSCIGGIYSVVALFIVVDKISAFVIDISVLILMCIVVYYKRNESLGRILKSIFLYFFVSALLGGLMTSLFSFFNRLEIFAKDMDFGDGIDVWIFVVLTIVSSFITIKGGRIFRTSSSKRLIKIEIESELGVAKLDALVDSANFATEPISGKSVVIVSVEKCKKILEESLYCSIKNYSKISIELISKIRLVPTQSIAGELFLPAMKFKSVVIKSGKRKKEIDVYVAFVNDEYLSGYDAIISQETII
jgi:sigma-E processing peptidase SpoIIGA